MKDSLKKILLSKNILAVDSVASGGKKIIPENKPLIGAMLKSFNSLGYTLNKKAVLKLSKFNPVELKLFYKEAYKFLSDVAGASVNTKKIFYQKFPEIQDMSEAEMYFHASMHYLTVFLKDVVGGDFVYYPEEEEFVRLPFDEKVKPIALNVLLADDDRAKETVLRTYFLDSFEGPVAIPSVKLTALNDVIDHFMNGSPSRELEAFVPHDIPFKENMVCYISMMAKLCGGLNEYLSAPGSLGFLKTVTDALRLYATLSTGHAMIPAIGKYKSFGRPVRRAFLSYLESTMSADKSKAEDLAKHREEWLRVFEKLHPGEFKRQYPATFEYASELRNGTLMTFNHYVEEAFANGDAKEVVRLLSKRPGYFIRAFDKAFRRFHSEAEKGVVCEGVVKILPQVSLPVLVQFYNHLVGRFANDDPFRAFGIKGVHGTTYFAKKEDRPSVKGDPRISMVMDEVMNAIGDKVAASASDLKGKSVYVSPKLCDYKLPANDRAVSDNIRAVPFGSHIKVGDDKNVVRLFSHWHNMEGNHDQYDRRVDIDLSAQIYDGNFNYIRSLSWHNPYYNGNALAFSGDITDAPHGANEFIDINLAALAKKEPEARYFVIVNNVFTRQRYCDIPECYTGAMLREGVGDRGEVFEPSTVVAKFNMTQPVSGGIACVVFDAKERKLYNVDMPLAPSPKTGGKSPIAVSQVTGWSLLIRNATAPGLSMMDLIASGAKGEDSYSLVNVPEEADYVISDDDEADLHPWDQEKFAKTFMLGIDTVE